MPSRTAKPTAGRPFAKGRKMAAMVKPDGRGGFIALASAEGFGSADEARHWTDRLIELMAEIDATHPGPQTRN